VRYCEGESECVWTRGRRRQRAITNEQGSRCAEHGSDGIRNKEMVRERERRWWKWIEN
jgi:hypothetical protein